MGVNDLCLLKISVATLKITQHTIITWLPFMVKIDFMFYLLDFEDS